MKLKSKNYYIYVFSCKGSVNFISNSKRGKKETTYMHSYVCAQRERRRRRRGERKICSRCEIKNTFMYLSSVTVSFCMQKF